MLRVECIETKKDGSVKKSKFEYSTNHEVMLNSMYENTRDKIKNQRMLTLVEILAFFSYHVAKKIRENNGEDRIELELRDFLRYDNVLHTLQESNEIQFAVIADRYPKKIIHLFLESIPKLID
ncbi:hypothetical protein C6988_04200 [Nitrosopumilus sp. b1]|uniref:hypothetical protein n=1 Tax=Nitrosopumilus sp. b1 TaxID=2109907 RepID=UPI0015F46D52|nr:hypothetical protein [Nitrosopumilus sp. b1]KAF6243283.1 hypothetical protein C6988_04200 [Nitrosopumilus sp. b1]